jgi:methionyl-tRNA formyltransferase
MRYMTRDEFMALKRIPESADARTVDRYARAFWYPPYDCAYIERDGVRMEVVPAVAKEQIAPLIHGGDYQRLRAAAAGR